MEDINIAEEKTALWLKNLVNVRNFLIPEYEQIKKYEEQSIEKAVEDE